MPAHKLQADLHACLAAYLSYKTAKDLCELCVLLWQSSAVLSNASGDVCPPDRTIR